MLRVLVGGVIGLVGGSLVGVWFVYGFRTYQFYFGNTPYYGGYYDLHSQLFQAVLQWGPAGLIAGTVAGAASAIVRALHATRVPPPYFDQPPASPTAPHQEKPTK